MEHFLFYNIDEIPRFSEYNKWNLFLKIPNMINIEQNIFIKLHEK